MRRGRFGCPPTWLSPCGHRCLAVPLLPEGTLGRWGQEKKPLLPHPCPAPSEEPTPPPTCVPARAGCLWGPGTRAVTAVRHPSR